MPGTQEVRRIFAGTAGAEFVDHGLECRKRPGAVDPNVSAVSFLFAERQHLYRRFIKVDDALGRHCFSQNIYQLLKLYAGLAHPRKFLTRDSQAGTAEDLSCRYRGSWKLVGELRHHHMRQRRRHWGCPSRSPAAAPERGSGFRTADRPISHERTAKPRIRLVCSSASR